eukprot:scaffold5159_cov112-Cylindrotheca_fusiformis.AAC.27
MEFQVASMFFFSCLAVILAVVSVVYAVGWFFDSFLLPARVLLTPEEAEEQRVASSLVRDAGLAGLLSHEIDEVTRHFFEQASSPSGMNLVGSNLSEAEVKPRQYVASKKELDFTTSIRIEIGDGSCVSKAKLESSSEKICTGDVETGMDNTTRQQIGGRRQRVCGSRQQEDDFDSSKGERNDEFESNNDANELEIEENDVVDKNIEVSRTCVPVEFSPSHSLWHLLQHDKNKKEDINDKGVEYPASDSECGSETMEPAKSQEDEEEGGCPICLCDYENGEKTVVGNSCGHMYHFECLMQWMEKRHNECPFCRTDMISSDEFLSTAYEVLGEKRVDKLRRVNEEATKRLASVHQ